MLQYILILTSHFKCGKIEQKIQQNCMLNRNIDQDEWLTTYLMIKNNKDYNFFTTQIDTYAKKLNHFITHRHHQANEKGFLDEVQKTFIRLVEDINMLDLPNLASCIEHIFDKMFECLRITILHCDNVLRELKKTEEDLINRSWKSHQCVDCKKHIYQSKMQELIQKMTLTRIAPDVTENIKDINFQIQQISLGMENAELTIMIDEILRNRQILLHGKNQNTSIYDQISTYLETIPQSIINMSRQQNNNNNTAQIFTLGSFSGKIQQNLNSMLKKPINRLIKRILDLGKRIYSKQCATQSRGIQTKMTPQEEQLQKAKKQNEVLTKEINQLKRIKRQTEAELVKMIGNQQRQDMKILELASKNSQIQKKYNKAINDLKISQRKAEQFEKSKKNSLDTQVKDHISEKSIMLRTIRELSFKLENAERKIQIFRKQIQDQMNDAETQIQHSFFMKDFQIQASKSDQSDQQDHRTSILKQNKHRKFLTNPSKVFTKNPLANLFQSTLENQEKQDIIYDEADSQKQVSNHKANQDAQKSQSSGKDKINSMGSNTFQKQPQKIERGKKKSNIYQQKDKSSIGGGLSMRSFTQKEKINAPRQASQKIRISMKNGLNLDIKKKQKTKITSTRMFQPHTHSTPYATPYNGSTYTNQAFQFFDIASKINYEKIENKETKEKFCFVKKVTQAFDDLKTSGILSKIVEIMQEPRYELQNAQTERIATKNSFQNISEKTGEIKKRKICQGKKEKDQELNQKQSKSMLYIPNLGKHFEMEDGLLLFETIDNMKKYERKTGVWGLLDSALIIDYNYMSICDKISRHLMKIRSINEGFYSECEDFLLHPYEYFHKSKNKEAKLIKKPKNSHNRNFSSASGSSSFFATWDPKAVFHMLFRFHNMQHKHCSHVQDFLHKIGFKE